MVKSVPVAEGTPIVKGYDFNTGRDLDGIMAAAMTTGFQVCVRSCYGTMEVSPLRLRSTSSVLSHRVRCNFMVTTAICTQVSVCSTGTIVVVLDPVLSIAHIAVAASARLGFSCSVCVPGPFSNMLRWCSSALSPSKIGLCSLYHVRVSHCCAGRCAAIIIYRGILLTVSPAFDAMPRVVIRDVYETLGGPLPHVSCEWQKSPSSSLRVASRKLGTNPTEVLCFTRNDCGTRLVPPTTSVEGDMTEGVPRAYFQAFKNRLLCLMDWG